MCKYCENIQGIWFKHNDNKQLGAIFRLDICNQVRNVLSVQKDNEWLDFDIKYCPMCGRRLKHRTFKMLKKDLQEEHTYKEIDKGEVYCKNCNKKLDNVHYVHIEGKNAYCLDCIKELENKENDDVK